MVARERSAAEMFAGPGELPTILGSGMAGEPILALRTTLWPSPFWYLVLRSLVVAEELLELFAVVLERNRFRTGAAACKRSETSPEQLPAPSAETAPVPAAASVRNLSNTFFRSASKFNAFHVPSIFSCNYICDSIE